MQSARRAWPLRHHLFLLVAGALLPVTAFGVALAWRTSSENRRGSEQRLVRASHDLTLALDREFESTFRAMTALATSERLEHEDLAAFRNEALRMRSAQPSWSDVLLLNRDGQIVLDTSRAISDPPTTVVERESFEQILQMKQPTIGFLKRGPEGQLAFPIRVPVLSRDGTTVRFVLTVLMQPPTIAKLIAGREHAEWVRSVIDARGTIVARTREPEQFVGTSATGAFFERTKERAEDLFASTTLDGRDVYTAYSRSSLSGWTTIIALPREVLDLPLRRSLIVLCGVGGTMLLIGSVGAILFARRVSRAITASADAADTLARGGQPAVTGSNVKEIAKLHDALVRAGTLLADRERERNEHLTAAETARAEAEAASGAKDRFLATLSHELRTPLTPALAAAQMLESDATVSADGRETLAMIRRNIQLEVKLIDDLLDLTRVSRGRLELHRTNVNLHEMVREVVQICDADARAKRQAITFDLTAPRAVVWGDAARLQQVLWNLLKNAIKFTPADGSITIRSRLNDGDVARVDITIIDNGLGMEAATIARVFDPFEQGSERVGREFGGLGLGLSISKSIVDAHGGSITAHSDGPTRGSTFTITLPLSTSDVSLPRVQPSAPTTSTVPPANARVLLVEDNADTSHVMAMALRRFGYDVRTETGVSSALRAAESQTFDVVVSDLGLPDGTGYELMQQLLKRQAIKGVAVSGYGMTEDIKRSIDAGFSQHLTKPIDLATLERTLRELTDRRV